MWVRFEKRASKIFPDRSAFYYVPDDCFDLPEEWCRPWIAEGLAVQVAPPPSHSVGEAWVPPVLGDEPLTVACVWKRGESTYDQHDYITPLRNAVARHLPQPHRFVCLTDAEAVPEGVERIPLRHGWRGFWSKVELFRPGLFRGPALYFDLDTIICGDITPLAAFDGPVLASWDLQHGWLNSSLLRWQVDLSCIYEAMVADPAGVQRRYDGGALWGDQGLIQDTLTERNIPWRWAQDVFTEAVQWHPNHQRHTAPMPGTIVALWYGHPKPHEVSSKWVDTHWR
jgi:hypothetical protein